MQKGVDAAGLSASCPGGTHEPFRKSCNLVLLVFADPCPLDQPFDELALIGE
jgi:hypothetical protein